MLCIVPTPIGNLGDITSRALDALRAADVIACEDTRRTWQLLAHFGIPRPQEMLSYRQGNEERVGERIAALLEGGKNVALCSDGGSPGISDPGYRILSMAVERGYELTVLPGPCAAITAVLLSGLPTSSFTFKGFPPRKPGALARFFESEKDAPHTLIVYEAPYRIRKTLQAAFAALGDRKAAICFEMTKLHERVQRGFLSELCASMTGDGLKGEAVVVIAGANPKFARVPENCADGADDGDSGTEENINN